MTAVEPIRNLESIKKIETYLKNKNFRDYILFLIGINCGLRISDILALNVKDVKNRDYISLQERKTGKHKIIPINDKLKREISSYVKNKNDEEPLFTAKTNNRLDRFNSYKIIKKACLINSINTKIGTHSLRKTFGYHYYKKYNDIVMLQKILNHSAPSTTLRYIGIEQEKIYESYLNFTL